MFDNLLTDTIDIYRVSQGPGVQTSYGTDPYNSGVACLIIPIEPDYTSMTDQNYGRTYKCILNIGSDIGIADRVIDENGKTYSVTGTEKRNYTVTNIPNLTVILTEEASSGPDD